MPAKEDSILTAALHQEVENRFLTYALSTIVSRSLPDVRDGLKSVVRHGVGRAAGETSSRNTTFGWLVTELTRLAAIGARIVGWGLLLVMPPLAATGMLVPRLLKQHDINYYLESPAGIHLHGCCDSGGRCGDARRGGVVAGPLAAGGAGLHL